MVKTQRLIKG